MVGNNALCSTANLAADVLVGSRTDIDGRLSGGFALDSGNHGRVRKVGFVPEAEQYQTMVNQPVAIRTKLHHNETATKCSVCQ
jgi:hypothetical protein